MTTTMAETNSYDSIENQPLITHAVNTNNNNNNNNNSIGSLRPAPKYTEDVALVTSKQEDKYDYIPLEDYVCVSDSECPPQKNHIRFIESQSEWMDGHDGTVLTYEQATTLIITLENTKNVIQNYLHHLEGDGLISPAPRRKSWWGLHCWPQKRRWLYRYITIVTVTLQFMNLLILSLLDAWPKPEKEWPYIVASSVTMIILQLINLLFLILASGRLVKQIYRNSVNSVFLAQTYGATILLFAGLYTLTYRLQRHSWRFVNENLYEDPIQVFVLYAKFLFYSISTATLCGSDNVLPEYWFNCLFAGFQMLLSFCYFASILGAAMCHDSSRSQPLPTSPLLSSISTQKERDNNYSYHTQNRRPQHHSHYQFDEHRHQKHHQCPYSPQGHFNGLTTQADLMKNQCCNGSSTPTKISETNQSYQCANPILDSTIQHSSNTDSVLNNIMPSHKGEINGTFSSQDILRASRLDNENGKTRPVHSRQSNVDVEVMNSEHLQIDHMCPCQKNEMRCVIGSP